MQRIIELYGAVHSVIDAVCRCVRYASAACRIAFGPIFPNVVHEILKVRCIVSRCSFSRQRGVALD